MDGELDQKAFRESVSQFTFKCSPPSTPLRSARNLLGSPSVKLESQSPSKELDLSTLLKLENTEDHFDIKPAVRRSSRKVAVKEESNLFTSHFDSKSHTKRKRGDTSGSSAPAKKQRGYAAPETYAHLEVLPDHLKDELDGE